MQESKNNMKKLNVTITVGLLAEVGLIATAGKANSNSRVALDAFPTEHIVITTTAAQ